MENNKEQSYKPFLAGIVDTAKSLGSTVQSFKKERSQAQPQQQASASPLRKFNQGFSSLGTVTTPYGGSTNYEQFHPGIDIANKIGTPVPALTGGIVERVVNDQRSDSKGFGNYVIVKDATGNTFRYSHLNNSFMQVGQQLQQGQQLGTMGNTGSTYSTTGGTGAHLDLRIRDAYGKFIDPTKFF